MTDQRSLKEEFLSAAHKGHFDTLVNLINKGVPIDTVDGDGLTAMHVLTMGSHVRPYATPIVKLLLSCGLDPMTEDIDGDAAFMNFASNDKYIPIMELLIAKGINLNHENQDGITALMIAAKEGAIKMTELLLKHGAHADLQSKHGYTAHDYACHRRNLRSRADEFKYLAGVLKSAERYDRDKLYDFFSGAHKKQLPPVDDLMMVDPKTKLTTVQVACYSRYFSKFWTTVSENYRYKDIQKLANSLPRGQQKRYESEINKALCSALENEAFENVKSVTIKRRPKR